MTVPPLDGLNDSGFPASQQQSEEADRLRRGIQAWCVTADEHFDSITSAESGRASDSTETECRSENLFNLVP